MTARPDPIRIDDLREPLLTPEQRAAINAASRIPISLTENAVLDAARAQTGLSDFGADDFRERLRVWLQAAGEDTGLGPVGRVGFFRDCVRYAANRLRFEELWRRHPEIGAVEIRRPIIVAGLPRSGTTHLLNLIAADARLRSLPYWESLEPVPDPQEPRGSGREDPRRSRCAAGWAQQDRLLPLLKNMHEMSPDHVHEEIELQAIDFSSYIPEWIATVPRWRDYYLAHDQTLHYAYLKRVLQALQWLRVQGGRLQSRPTRSEPKASGGGPLHGPERWVLKSPQHLEQLVPLYETFPDAAIAITHRDPVSVISSAVTLNAYGDRLRRVRVDPKAVAAYWIDRIERLLRACVRDRDAIPAEQSIDVLFHEFMADDVGMVERIYALADLPMSRDARASLEHFMQEHPRGRYGQIVYDLKGDFGVDPSELRRRFEFYFERFPIETTA